MSAALTEVLMGHADVVAVLCAGPDGFFAVHSTHDEVEEMVMMHRKLGLMIDEEL